MRQKLVSLAALSFLPMYENLIYSKSISSFVTGVSSIQVSHVTVPHQVGRGHDAQLHCHFNLGGNRLYSVKWYKGRLYCSFSFHSAFSSAYTVKRVPRRITRFDLYVITFLYRGSIDASALFLTGSSEFFRVVHPDGGLPSPVKFQVFPHLSNLTVDVISLLYTLSFLFEGLKRNSSISLWRIASRLSDRELGTKLEDQPCSLVYVRPHYHKRLELCSQKKVDVIVRKLVKEHHG